MDRGYSLRGGAGAGGRLAQAVLEFESFVKRRAFGCKSCGQCILQWTAFTCPMRCPKGLRNGPCGGATAQGRCEVEPERPCVWTLIWRRSRRWGKLGKVFLHQPTLDWRLFGTSAWCNHVAGRDAALFGELRRAERES